MGPRVGGRAVGMKGHKHRRLLKGCSHDQRIRSRVGTWGSDHSLISPSRDVLHVHSADEFVTSSGASSTSNAGASFASNDTVFDITTVLGNGISARETATDSTEGAANGARSTAAAWWGKLAGRIVIPSRSGLVLHLSGELGQDVGRQLPVSVGLGNIVTELGRVIAIVHHAWVLIGDWGLMASDDRAASGGVVGRCSMRELASMEELSDCRVGLGATRNLLRMSVGHTVLVSWERRGIVGKLVVSGRRSRSGGLAGFDHVDSSSAADLLHILGRARMVEVILSVVLHILLILLLSRGYNNLNLAAEHQRETVTAGGLLQTGEARSIAPFV